MKKERKIRVSYTVTLKPHEFKALVALATEWGYGYNKESPLKLVKRALQNCGVSGCLSNVATRPDSGPGASH
jgi:hypothetical protein